MGLWTIWQNVSIYLNTLVNYLLYNICYTILAPSSNQFAPKSLDLGATLLLRKNNNNFEAALLRLTFCTSLVLYFPVFRASLKTFASDSILHIPACIAVGS